MSTELQCYNISCGKTYLEDENHDDACQYHPGKPYFHDGYKEWTCCKMRSRDFSVFMGFKGCTKGRHNNVKPEPEPSKPESTTTTTEQPNGSDASNQINQATTTTTTSSNLNDKGDELCAFTPPDPNLVENIPIVESASVAKAPAPPKSIKICKNCKQEESTLDQSGPCKYHKGVQIFHDAYKFWSCCQHKKFSDFEDFQKLPPCAQADQHELMVKVDYKENWFQTGGTLTIALYGLKGARKMDGQSKVVLKGGRKLYARFVNENGLTIFEKEWLLRDYVIADGCKVNINPSNVQITLRKANEKFHWPSLLLEQ